MKMVSNKACIGIMLGALMILAGGTNIGYASYEDGVLPELNIEASANFDVYSKYIWRGFTLDTDPVIQPGFNLSGYGLTMSFWGSYDTAQDDASSSDEQDFIIDYTKEFELASVSIGHTYYSFPTADAYSKEWYAGISLPIMFSPSLTYYYDYGKEARGCGHGSYVNLAVSKSLPISEQAGIYLDLGASVGFNNKLFIKGEGGDFTLIGKLTVPLTKGLTMSPMLGYVSPFGDLKDSNDGNQKSRFYTGISLGLNF